MQRILGISLIIILGMLAHAAAGEWPSNWLGPADNDYRALKIGVYYHAAILHDLADRDGNPALPGDPADWLEALTAREELTAAEMEAEMHRVSQEVDEAARFYWLNTRFNCALELTWIPDFEPRLRSTIADPEAPWFRPVDHPYYGDAREQYDGLLQIMVLYKYDEASGELKRVRGGGGWTWGASEDDMLCGWSWWAACTEDNACGSDWLVVHEFGHQLDSLFHVSGHPEVWFNHLAPSEGNIARFGEHFDANAYILRRIPEQDWHDLAWGELREFADADADHVPDASDYLETLGLQLDPDPTSPDSDGDGLDDYAELLASNGITIGHGERLYPALKLCDPFDRDTDRDGVVDGLDPLPMLPMAEFIPQSENDEGQASVLFADSPDGMDYGFKLAYSPDEYDEVSGELTAAGFLDLAISWDKALGPDQLLELKVMLDLDNDGWFIGSDNYRILISGNRTVEVVRHDASSMTEWPFIDKDAVTADIVVSAASLFPPEDYNRGILLRLDKSVFPELAAKPGEVIGFNIGIRKEGWRWYYMLGEPNTLIPLELR